MATVASGPRDFGHAQGRDDVRSRRGAGEQPILAGEPPCRNHGVVGGHLHDLVDLVRLPQGRYQADADALDAIGAGGAAREHRRFGRLDGDHAQVTLVRAQGPCRAVDAVRGADDVHEGIDVPVRLRPDLLTEGQVAGDGVLVVELVAPPGSGLGGDLLGSGYDGANEDLGNLAVFTRHLLHHRTVGTHRLQLLGAEGVGRDGVKLIAEHRTCECQGDSSGPRGVIDDRVAGPQPPALDRSLDGGTGHPVLHAAGGVGPFELDHDARSVGRRKPGQFDERCVPDAVERVHAASLSLPEFSTWVPDLSTGRWRARCARPAGA